MIGQHIAHFRIVDDIGSGGMGVVHRAYDERLERDIALKVLPVTSFRDPTARARLLREARTASKLNHPNICTIHEVGEANGQSYIAMEYVQGQPLSSWLSSGALSADQVVDYGIQLADALAHAHKHGVVHRDLKSANIVVTPEGRVKVLDFGLAKQLGEEELAETVSQTLTAPGTVVGTLAYMSPEQLRGKPADPRSDVWALGVVLHEMSSGKRPFQGTTGFELSSAILSQPAPPLPPECSAGLRNVIERCLAKDPGARYQQAVEVRAALSTVQTGTAIPAAHEWRQALTRRRWLLLMPVLAAAAIALSLYGGRLRRLLPAGTAIQKYHSLAVLPLVNVSNDPQQEYFTDGITIALIDDLSKVSTLLVIAPDSIMRYKKIPKPLQETGRELGAETLVQGSVKREGGHVQVTAELIEAATQKRLWSQRYDSPFTGIRAMQGEMARAIAREIKGELSPQEETRMANRRQVNPQVLEAYLKGNYYLQQSTDEAIRKGMELLHEAVEKDPMDPLAYAGLAWGYISQSHGVDPPADALPRAKAAARTALELDGSMAEAVFALGVIKGYFEFDWEGGEQAIQRAIELNPSLAMAHYHLAWFRALLWHVDEAITAHKRARECDPLNPLHTAWLGELYRMQGRHKEALDETDKAVKLNPDDPIAYFVRSLVFSEQGNYPEALAAVKKAAEVDPAWQLSQGPIFAVAGRKDEARRMMADLREQKASPWNAFWRAVTYAALGEKDEAFLWMNYEHPHIWVTGIVCEEWPFLTKALHDDPRLRDLQRRRNLR